MGKKWFVILLIGILLIIVGFLFSTPDNYPFIRKLVTPDYLTALALYEKMKRSSNLIVSPADNGFEQITNVIHAAVSELEKKGNDTPGLDRYTKLKSWNIGKIQVLKYIPYALFQDGSMAERFQLKIWSTTNENSSFDFYNVGKNINNIYKTHVIFQYGSLIFWAGICIALIALFLDQSGYWINWR